MHFVVSIDRSDASRAAVKHAASLADRFDASLTLVHASEPTVRQSNDSLVHEGEEQAEERGLNTLDWGVQTAQDYGINPDTELLLDNSPIDAVTSYLDSVDCDSVFVGHRALAKQDEYIGSFAKSLLGCSPVPVTVVSASSL